MQEPGGAPRAWEAACLSAVSVGNTKNARESVERGYAPRHESITVIDWRHGTFSWNDDRESRRESESSHKGFLHPGLGCGANQTKEGEKSGHVAHCGLLITARLDRLAPR